MCVLLNERTAEPGRVRSVIGIPDITSRLKRTDYKRKSTLGVLSLIVIFSPAVCASLVFPLEPRTPWQR